MADPEETDLPHVSNVPNAQGGPSLEDEIFSVASNVEMESPQEAAPRLKVRRWERSDAPSASFLRAAGAGFGTFLFVDLVMMSAPLMMSRRPSLLPQMVTLIVFAFGLGSLLIWKVGGTWRPFGYGMMAGWCFLTLISVGFLTGLTGLPF
ncbi:hypothetical protein [Actinomadura barringtoniae]|uniref:hypothetical protein n=1 Tax=Actinomadura barringtoniae TaxID=1427535 RepID=UPI001FB67189|nr:hypothetical protein [Actinomadura barringtoniae]